MFDKSDLVVDKTELVQFELKSRGVYQIEEKGAGDARPLFEDNAEVFPSSECRSFLLP